MATDVMIETRGLTKEFGKLLAVNGLDVKVEKGVQLSVRHGKG